MKYYRTLFYGILLLCQFLSQGQSEYFPKEQWRTSDPEAQGLDSEKLNEFVGQLKSGNLLGPISSFSIVKNGYLVTNETFGNYDGDVSHTMQSVTKSITSTLIGVAIQKGLIEDLDQKVLSFFPEYNEIANDNAWKQSMTICNALNMRTGQSWTGEKHLGPLNRYPGDKMKYVLDYHMESAPGKKWYYNSGIAILMGGLIQNATGMNTKKFAQDHLFSPLNITSATWSWGHRGIPHTGGGLYLNPEDMLRIGYLYLRDGIWDGQQILPRNWVNQMFDTPVYGVKRFPGGIEAGYSRMWWMLPRHKNSNKLGILMAYGHWGQFIFVIPEHDMIVTFTNDNSANYYEEIEPIALMYKYVLKWID